MLTCQKTFLDIPWAHRLHRHDGACAFVHGHNWAITLTFACERPDENGFVVDFGKLDFIAQWLDTHLSHACVFAESDPLKDALLAAAPQAWKPYLVADNSSEGMAAHLFSVFDPLVRAHTKGRVRLASVEIGEETHASARYAP